MDRNIIKEQAAEKKQRQVINKLVRGAEMKKEEALKAVEQMKTPETRATRGKTVDYAALAGKNFRIKIIYIIQKKIDENNNTKQLNIYIHISKQKTS